MTRDIFRPMWILTYLCLVDSSIILFRKVHFKVKSVLYVFFIVSSFIVEIHVLNTNSVDPDQTPRSVASDLRLYCLPVKRYKWVKSNFSSLFGNSANDKWVTFSFFLRKYSLTFLSNCLQRKTF